MQQTQKNKVQNDVFKVSQELGQDTFSGKLFFLSALMIVVLVCFPFYVMLRFSNVDCGSHFVVNYDCVYLPFDRLLV